MTPLENIELEQTEDGIVCEKSGPPGAIYKAIAAIMREIKPIAKNGFNKSQGYSFRSIDDVCNALHPYLAKHNVFYTAEVVGQPNRMVLDRFDRKTGQKTGSTIVVSMIVKFTFRSAEDGSAIVVTYPGEGADTADKASYKAMSMALKYALIQLFCIPTGQIDGDAGPIEEEDNAVTRFLAKKRPEISEHAKALSLLDQKRELLRWVADYLKQYNSEQEPGAFIGAAVKDLLDKPTIETPEEIEQVSEAIRGGWYDPVTGQRKKGADDEGRG